MLLLAQPPTEHTKPTIGVPKLLTTVKSGSLLPSSYHVGSQTGVWGTHGSIPGVPFRIFFHGPLGIGPCKNLKGPGTRLQRQGSTKGPESAGDRAALTEDSVVAAFVTALSGSSFAEPLK